MDLLTLLASLGIPPSILVYVTTAVTLATALDALLPHWTSPAWLASVRSAIGFVAISFGHAKPPVAAQPAPAEVPPK